MNMAKSVRPESDPKFVADTAHDKEHYKDCPVLQEALQYWEDKYLKDFEQHDKEACSLQWWLRRLVPTAAFWGSFALFCGLVELYLTPQLSLGLYQWKVNVEWLDIVLTLCALIAIVAGLKSTKQMQWITNRHQAERLKIERYRFLIRVAAAMEMKSELRESIANAARHIRNLALRRREELASSKTEAESQGEEGGQSIEETAYNFPYLEPPSIPRSTTESNSCVDLLFEDYMDRRLSTQINYLQQRISEANLKGKFREVLSWIPITFLFASIFCAVLGFMIPFLSPASNSPQGDELQFVPLSWPEAIGRTFVLLALLLPVLGAATKAWLGAFETGRNISRYEAVLRSLEKVRAIAKPDLLKAQDKIDLMWQGEHILERESYAWIRLMIEADLFT